MSKTSAKHAAVAELIDTLRKRLGTHSIAVVDHWPDDPLAVGIASPKDPRVMAYVSVTPGAQEPYFVSLELPPEGESIDHPYLAGDDRNECALEELVHMIGVHMGRAQLNS
jgi:hypothetical protein